MCLRSQNEEPKVNRCKSYCKSGKGGSLIDGRWLGSKALSIDSVGHDKGWYRQQSQWKNDVEIQDQVEDVEVPGFGTIQVRAPCAASKDVIAKDVPRHDGQTTVGNRVYCNHGELGRQA